MARTSGNRLTSQDLTLLVVALVGFALIVTAMLTPWWTRGITADFDSETNPRDGGALDGFGMVGAEGIYLSYGPFNTPGGTGISTDAEREFATALLGITVVLSALFIKACLALHVLNRTGRVQVDGDVRVRLAIAAFIAGLAAILIAAFILPVAGPNPGWLYGGETETTPGVEAEAAEFGFEIGRFANVGFFAGILAFVGYPAFLWANAANERAAALAPSTRKKTTEPAY